MIQGWQIPQHYMSIARYMEIELPVSRVFADNKLLDAVTVEVIRTDNLGLWIHVGRLADGYCASIDYAVPTGGSVGGVYSYSPRAKDKIEALLAGLQKAAQSYWITRHNGATARIEAAIREVESYKAKQLTLF